MQAPLGKNLSIRVRELATARNYKAASLARDVGVSKSSGALYWAGERPWPTEVLPKLASVLGVSIAELLDGHQGSIGSTRDRKLSYVGPPQSHSDTVEVAEIDLRYGMGATFLDDVVDATPRSFSRAWLRNFTDSAPDELFWARGQGNSMEPEIRDGDIVLIDRRQQSLVMADLIWAFAYGDTGMIKWLRPMPDGSVEIHSSNQSVRPAKAYDGEINLVGRVVAVVKRL